MKTITVGFLALVSYFGITISIIWAFVEFVLHLVKDKEFNWWSVWMILICIISAIVFGISAMVIAVQEKLNAPKRALSKFSQQLKEKQGFN